MSRFLKTAIALPLALGSILASLFLGGCKDPYICDPVHEPQDDEKDDQGDEETK
jgi:hypothetical protein